MTARTAAGLVAALQKAGPAPILDPIPEVRDAS